MDKLDNNNGILFVYIDDSFKLSYCFFNPVQAETGIKGRSISAREYIKAYYSDKEISEDKAFLEELKSLMKVKFVDLMSREYPRFGN